MISGAPSEVYSLLSKFTESVDAMQEFLKSAQVVKFQKNDIIFGIEKPCDKVFFFNTGVVRCYRIIDDIEVNFRLLVQPNVAVQYASFITGEKPGEYIACVSSCQGLFIRKLHFKKLFEKYPELLGLQLELANSHYLSMEQRVNMLHLKTVKERYLFFKKQIPADYIKKIPAYHIASYLGVTPESLSRAIKEEKIS